MTEDKVSPPDGGEVNWMPTYYQDRLLFVSGPSSHGTVQFMHVDWATEWAPTPEEKHRLAYVPKPSWKLSPLERAAQGRAARKTR